VEVEDDDGKAGAELDHEILREKGTDVPMKS
jgi:hypothetical protein